MAKAKNNGQATPRRTSGNGMTWAIVGPDYDNNPPALQQPPNPAPTGRQVISVEAMTQGLYTSAARILQNPDWAFRFQRQYQRQMRNDPVVDEPLEGRMLAVRSLGWTIDPEDPEDPLQRARAAAIEKAIKRIPRFNQALRWLLMSIWYGHSAVNFVYDVLDKPVRAKVLKDPENPVAGESGEVRVTVAPVKWLPLHPDALEFRTDGALSLKVNITRLQDPDNYTLSQSPTGGPCILLNPVQRASVVVSVSAAEAGDWNDPQETALPFSGRGLRAALIQYWIVKQATLQAAVRYTERMSGGLTIGKYPTGNPDAEAAMRTVLDNLLVDANILMPVPGGMDELQWGVEWPMPTGQGWQTFESMLDRMERTIKQRIIGQELTSGTAPTGLGSGVAEAHERTFDRIIKDDAASLDDDVSEQLVAPLVAINWPDDDGRYRFRTLVEDEDLDKVMEFAKSYTGMGGTIDGTDLRQRAGLRPPKPGGETLGGFHADPLGNLSPEDLLADEAGDGDAAGGGDRG